MVEIDELPGETMDGTITLKWKEPESNGKDIGSIFVSGQPSSK